MTYDLVARVHKGETVFEANTDKGRAYIAATWGNVPMTMGNLVSASLTVRQMEREGMSVTVIFNE